MKSDFRDLATNVEALGGFKASLSLKKGGPGVVFAMFGAAISIAGIARDVRAGPEGVVMSPSPPSDPDMTTSPAPSDRPSIPPSVAREVCRRKMIERWEKDLVGCDGRINCPLAHRELERGLIKCEY